MTEQLQAGQSPQRGQMERKRVTMCLCVILCGAFIIGLTFLCKSISRTGIFWCLCPLLGTGASALFLRRPWREYRAAYRTDFVCDALKSEFPGLRYEPFGGIPVETIADTGMAYMGHRGYVTDGIQMRCNGLSLEQSYIRAEVYEVSYDDEGGKSAGYVPVVSARWMIFDFDNPFRADLRIAQKGFHGTSAKWFCRSDYQNSFERTGVSLDSSSKKFIIYCRNGPCNPDSVTPALMERIEALAKHTRGKLMIGFIGNRLHIAVDDDRNILDPPQFVFLPVRKTRALRAFRNEIEAVTQFVSNLQHNRNLFKQEVKL